MSSDAHIRAAIALTDDFGVPASHREAAAMAALGALYQDCVPITLLQVTGVQEPAPLAGAWVSPSPG
jgi:1,6-anhydro-N-acetylmuramate kinase